MCWKNLRDIIQFAAESKKLQLHVVAIEAKRGKRIKVYAIHNFRLICFNN
jgi:hypothetical protein